LSVEEESGSQMVALGEEEEVKEVVREVQVAAPPLWGPLPALVMLPWVLVMFLVGLMGFELVQSAIGHRPPGMITKALGWLLGVAPKN
jgi:hypothetical protein